VKKVIVMVLVLVSILSQAKKARVVYLESEDMGKVALRVERATVLNFPTKPEKVICGNKNYFSIEFIENDVVISPIINGARSNLFVYLFGRRFGFDLITSDSDNDEIVVVRDPQRPQNEKLERKSKGH
jgi:hypothetical protein